jgi:hypothetical protein
MGLGDTEWQHFTPELAALIKSSGGQVLRYQMYSNWWVNNIQSWMYPGTYYRAKMMQIRQLFSDYGIKFWLDAVGYYPNPSEGWENMHARAIFNTNGAGDTWIATWSQIISALQPEIVGIMNEPGRISDASEYPGVTQAQYYTAYRQFVIRAINAYKAIKPDLIIAACSLPFYDFTAVVANPIPGVDFYEFHDYYALDNKYPPAYELGQRAYWDGNLAQAKTLQYERWLYSDVHLQAMFNAGLPVVMSESGANNLNPNYLIFMQDWYDFAKTYNVGILQCQFRAWDPLKGYYESGILETDNPGSAKDTWTRLNALGQLWARNMQS